MTHSERQRKLAHKQRKAAAVRKAAAGYVDGMGRERAIMSRKRSVAKRRAA